MSLPSACETTQYSTLVASRTIWYTRTSFPLDASRTASMTLMYWPRESQLRGSRILISAESGDEWLMSLANSARTRSVLGFCSIRRGFSHIRLVVRSCPPT